jgi:hypothetical protein
MTDEQLQGLLDDSFNPNEPVTILVRCRVSKFAEDIRRRRPAARKRRVSVKRPPKPPSEKFGPAFKKFVDKEAEADAQAVLGCYFHYYKELFEEEDPEWAGNRCVKPLYNINQMGHAVCGGDFSQLIDFIEELLPLWAIQLRKGLDFPSTRPTIDALFVRRKIWAQRFSLYRRWKS